MAGRLAGRAYLLCYNIVQSVGWLFALWATLTHIARDHSLKGLYDSAGGTVRVFQGLAVLEIVHAATGLVAGSPATAAVQWLGRSNVLFGVVASVPEAQNRVADGAMILAWALSEVVRYPWYAANVVGACPPWLTWLRYSAFIVLYPVGVMGEVASIWLALPLVRVRGVLTVRMPNAWNCSFNYYAFLVVLLALYPFLWFQLYAFLFKQRRKKLGVPRPKAA